MRLTTLALTTRLAGIRGANEQLQAIHLNDIWSHQLQHEKGLPQADERNDNALRLQGIVKHAF